jgi:hypothetical protein
VKEISARRVVPIGIVADLGLVIFSLQQTRSGSTSKNSAICG